jgi:hypothetical protein
LDKFSTSFTHVHFFDLNRSKLVLTTFLGKRRLISPNRAWKEGE